MTKPNIDTRALVAKLSQEGATLLNREIVAPLLPGGKIRTRLNGLVYEFKPQDNFVGWGLFRPINEREARLEGAALPWQRATYLELFPILRVILLWPVGDGEQVTSNPNNLGDMSPKGMRRAGAWWALPYNESDARQRFGFKGIEPVRVFLADPLDGAERFERVIVRVAGGILWYDGPDVLADPVQAEWLRDNVAAFANEGHEPEKILAGLSSSQKLALLYGQIRQLEIGEMAELQKLAEAELVGQNAVVQVTETTADTPVLGYQPPIAEPQNIQNLPGSRNPNGRLYKRMVRNRFEQRLRHALEKADATLHTYTETGSNSDGSPGQLVVEWSEHGQAYRYRTLIDRADDSFTVVSSGICLSGRDKDFDLTSLVNVMRGDDSGNIED